jgi:hypothetical protein
MKNNWKFLIAGSLLLALAFIGCKTAEQHAVTRQLADPTAEGRLMVESVYAAIQTDYVEQVHPHRLLVSAARAIGKEFNDGSLLQEISGEVRALSPVTRQPYSTDISESDAREALYAFYTYGVTAHGGGEPIKVSYGRTRWLTALTPTAVF